MTEEEGDGVSVRELAALLGVDPTTVYRWIRAGRVRAGRYPSGRRVIPRAEVDRIRRELEGNAQ